MKFKVFDGRGNDVTMERDWYIDKQGNLYFETNDVDCPLMDADGFSYEVVSK